MKVCCNSVTVKLSKEDSLNLTLLHRRLLELAVWYIRKMHDAQTNLCPVFLLFMTVLQLYNNLSD